MNERLTLQDLVDLLAKKQEITKKDAELFLRELVAIITENIEQNEAVKIKDFGTFKLVKVNSRRSVDVNTGEAIEIAAHYKLSFAPDKSLREAINRPFSHFESIILEDGVSFDNIESEPFDINEHDEGTEEDTTALNEERELLMPEKSIDKAIITESENKPKDLIDDGISETEDTTIIETEESVQIGNTIEPEASINNIKSITTSVEQPKDEDMDDEYEPERTSSRKWRYVYPGLFVAIVLVCLTVGGLYFGEISKFFSGGDAVESFTIAEQKETIPTDTLAQNSVNDSISNESVKTDNKTAETVSQSNTANKNLGEETIKEGHTLRLISLKYYGNKAFWVYIYQENKSKINNPNNVPIGTKLVIPSLEKYNVDPTNPQEVKKALKMERQIISQTNN